MTTKPRRSVLYMPGANVRALEKARTLAPDAKAEARTRVTEAVAAGGFGLDVIDGVYNDFKDEAGFRAECEQGRPLGMDGKTLIHPGQIAAANEVFSPGADDIAWSRRIIAAFAGAENTAKGVITIEGKMVERLHLAMAERIVAIAGAIAT